MTTDTFETGQRVEWDAGDDDAAGVHLGTYTKRDGAIPFFPHIVDSDDMGERRVAAGVLRPHTVAPAPAFLFVGARAQVTVAETDDGFRSDRVDALLDGDVVIVKDLDDGDRWCETTDGARCGYVAPRHLSPVPVSPGPDQPTEAEQPWRQVGALVWTGRDGVVMAERPEDAARAVDAVNAEAGLRAENQRLTRLCDDYSATLATRDAELAAESAKSVRLGDINGALARQRDNLVDQVKARTAERDAARAELAAAHNTDGLGLPEVRDYPDIRGARYVKTTGQWMSPEWRRDQIEDYVEDRRAPYLAALALRADWERARLADETTIDDKETDR